MADRSLLQPDEYPYLYAHVLLICWETAEKPFHDETERLAQTFRDDLNFIVHLFNIPSNKSLPSLTHKILGFLEYDSPETLLVLYYGGHGFSNTDNDLVWSLYSNGSPSVNWKCLQQQFFGIESHVLFFLDCCSAASAIGERYNGSVEALMGCGIEDKTPLAGDYCFTRRLSQKLRACSPVNGISVYDIYHQLHQEYNNSGPNRKGKGKDPVYAKPGKQLERTIRLRRMESFTTAKSSASARANAASRKTIQIVNMVEQQNGHYQDEKSQSSISSRTTSTVATMYYSVMNGDGIRLCDDEEETVSLVNRAFSKLSYDTEDGIEDISTSVNGDFKSFPSRLHYISNDEGGITVQSNSNGLHKTRHDGFESDNRDSHHESDSNHHRYSYNDDICESLLDNDDRTVEDSDYHDHGDIAIYGTEPDEDYGRGNDNDDYDLIYTGDPTYIRESFFQEREDAVHPVVAVLCIFPQAIDAAEIYRIGHPGRETRTLSRRISTEHTIFDQTAKRLSVFSKPYTDDDVDTWVQHLGTNFGPNTANQILHNLRALSGQLYALTAEITNTNRGQEVLRTIGRRSQSSVPGGDTNSKTRLRLLLGMVSRTNQFLTSRLSSGQTLLSHAFQTPNVSSICQWLQEIIHEARVLFQLLSDRQACRCLEPHRIYLSCAKITLGSASEQFAAAYNCSQLKLITPSRTEEPLRHSLCTFDALGFETNTAKISLIQDWVHLHSLDRKRRLKVALQLSCAVIQLSSTGWIEGNWNWNNWAISVDQDSHSTEGPLLFHRQLSSSNAFSEVQKLSPSQWSILSREPILARLGLCLVELVFGQTLSEIRRTTKDYGYEIGDSDGWDADSLDFNTVKQLLSSQRIQHQFGVLFDSAVRACINQQYRAEKGGQIFELDRRDPAFTQKATVSIISPLYSCINE